MGRSEEITEGIRVAAESVYVPRRSRPERDYYFFAYRIDIANEGDRPARLVSRHWLITDGRGEIQEVEGEGVVGETPRLLPGHGFRYTSYCPLPTPSGTMEGSYLFVRDDGEEFRARIGLFSLELPHSLN